MINMPDTRSSPRVCLGSPAPPHTSTITTRAIFLQGWSSSGNICLSHSCRSIAPVVQLSSRESLQRAEDSCLLSNDPPITEAAESDTQDLSRVPTTVSVSTASAQMYICAYDNVFMEPPVTPQVQLRLNVVVVQPLRLKQSHLSAPQTPDTTGFIMFTYTHKSRQGSD